MRKAIPLVWRLCLLLFGLTLGSSVQALAAPAGTSESKTVQEMANQLYPSLERRQAQFTAVFPQKDSSLLMMAFNAALQRDDYLREDYKSMQVQESLSGQSVTATYQVQYLESSAEVAYVKQHLSRMVARITRPDMEPLQKEEAIHNYIVLHTAYDTSLRNITPYDALTQGTTVCQGYAMMTYLMLKDAHIENTIVDGTADGQAHAWNLVEIDGHWYNLDVTWDDPVPNQPGKVYFDYFNLTDSQLARDHHWQRQGLPTATTDFVPWLSALIAEKTARSSDAKRVLKSTGLYVDTPAYTFNKVTSLTAALRRFRGSTMAFRYPAGRLATDLSSLDIVRPFRVIYRVDRRYPTYDIVTLTFTD